MSNKIPISGFYAPTKSESYSGSVFSEYFSADDLDSLNWALNVTQKAYDKGMIVEYIERRKSDDISDDKDYIDFWASISILFSYVVHLVRIIGIETENQPVFWKFLKQKGLFNDINETVDDLRYLVENLYDEIRQRGTIQISKERNEEKVVHGEILRYICYSVLKKDEFIFNLQEPYYTGWNVNSSSPLYKGIHHHSMLNKGYVDYPLIGSPTVSEGGFILSSGEGMGGSDNDFEVKMNPQLCYVIQFTVKKTTANGSFDFGIKGFDVEENEVGFENPDGVDSNNFLEGIVLPMQDVFYTIKGIVLPYDMLNIPEELKTTNLAVGNNLRSKIELRTIIPQLVCTSGEIQIKDFKMAVSYLDQTSSFIQTNNFINLAVINRNTYDDIQTIISNIRYFMFPYDCVLGVKFLDILEDQGEQEDVNVLGVLLNKEQQGLISGKNLLLYT